MTTYYYNGKEIKRSNACRAYAYAAAIVNNGAVVEILGMSTTEEGAYAKIRSYLHPAICDLYGDRARTDLVYRENMRKVVKHFERFQAIPVTCSRD